MPEKETLEWASSNNDSGQHAPPHQTRIPLTLLIDASYAVAP